MTIFDGRETAAEKVFSKKIRHKFEIEARRNKLLGLWLAELMGKEGDEANQYAFSVIKSDMEEVGDDDVFRKVKQDIADAGLDISDEDIKNRMEMLMEEAIKQIDGVDTAS